MGLLKNLKKQINLPRNDKLTKKGMELQGDKCKRIKNPLKLKWGLQDTSKEFSTDWQSKNSTASLFAVCQNEFLLSTQ